jgi:hypothetical protein
MVMDRNPIYKNAMDSVNHVNQINKKKDRSILTHYDMHAGVLMTCDHDHPLTEMAAGSVSVSNKRMVRQQMIIIPMRSGVVGSR